MKRNLAFLLLNATLLSSSLALAEVNEIKIPKGAGGVGFLPLLVMEQKGLVERNSRHAPPSLHRSSPFALRWREARSSSHLRG